MAAERLLTITTEFGDQLLIDAFDGQEGLGELFSYELQLICGDPSLDPATVVGTAMTVHIELQDGVRHVHGIASQVRRGQVRDQVAHFFVTLSPQLLALSLTADCRIFQRMTVPDVVKQVCQEYGVTAIEDALIGAYPAWEYLVQYRETALNFVTRLLEQEGIYFFFVHEADKHTLVLADAYAAHSTRDGYEEISCVVQSHAASPAGDHLREWTSLHQWRPGAYRTTDFDFTRPNASLEVARSHPGPGSSENYELYDYPGEYVVVAEGERLVRTRLEAAQVAQSTRIGDGNVRGVGAGDLFSLKDHLVDGENMEYLVTRCTLTANNPARSSGVGSGTGGTLRSRMTAIPSSVPYRPAPNSEKPAIVGPQTATVVGPSGEEIWTDSYGRIKVQFHWDRVGTKNEESSCWVRVTQQWAASGFGAQFIPRIGNEVVVEFLEGDPDRPLVTGCVYNATNMPPFELPSNATQSGWRTRSSKGGNAGTANELRFEDKAGQEQLYMQAEKDMDTLVKNNQSLTVGANRNKDITADESVHVGGSRTETVDVDETITVSGARTENVVGDEGITVGGSRTRTVAGDDTTSIAGSRTRNVGGMETVNVAAVQAITVGGAVNRAIGAAESVEIGAARNTSIGGVDVLSVGASRSVDVGAGRSTSVGTDDSLQVSGNGSSSYGGDHSVTVGKGYMVKIEADAAFDAGKNFSVKAGESVTVVTGEATLTLKKNGDIVVKGKDLKIEGSGKVNVKAGGDVVIKGSKVSLN